MRGREWILVEKIGMEQSSWPLLSLSLERMSVIIPNKARAQEVECIELPVDVEASSAQLSGSHARFHSSEWGSKG